MAVTAVIFDKEVPGAALVGKGEISFTGSTDYVTGGILVNAALFNLNRLDLLIPCCLSVVTAGIGALAYDQTNKKILLYTSAGVQCANALDISSIKIYCWVKGK